MHAVMPLAAPPHYYPLRRRITPYPMQPLHPAPTTMSVIRSICAFADDDPDCMALMAAHGPGSAILERNVVMRGPDWSAACLRIGGGVRLVVPDASVMQVGMSKCTNTIEN